MLTTRVGASGPPSGGFASSPTRRSCSSCSRRRARRTCRPPPAAPAPPPRRAAVAVALEPPAAADDRRRRRRVEVDERGQVGPRRRRRPRRRGRASTARRAAQLVHAGGVLARNVSSARPTRTAADDRERHGEVGARPHGQVEVGLPRELVARGSTTTSRAPRSLRLAGWRHEVDARRRGVGAPDDDEPRVDVVLVGDARHLAVQPHRGGARSARRRRCAPGARRRGGGRARRVGRVLRQQAVRAAVGVGEDRLAAVSAVARRDEPAATQRRAPRPS
jgi:hypothetical protein